jgi:predicted  nucleic acid-binding Zn-ribbon protein
MTNPTTDAEVIRLRKELRNARKAMVKMTVQLDALTKAIKDLKPEYKPQWYGSVRNDF